MGKQWKMLICMDLADIFSFFPPHTLSFRASRWRMHPAVRKRNGHPKQRNKSAKNTRFFVGKKKGTDDPARFIDHESEGKPNKMAVVKTRRGGGRETGGNSIEFIKCGPVISEAQG